MKICPTCRTQYTDDTLQFCLQDGSLLIAPLPADTPTVAFDETPTVVRASDSQVTARATQPDVKAIPAFKKKRRRSVIVSVLVACATLILLFAGAAIGYWIYQHNRREVANNNSANTPNSKQSPGNVSGYFPSSTPHSTASPTSKPPMPPETPPETDQGSAKQAVSQSVYSWSSAAETGDLDSYMGKYADTVDYYNRSALSRSQVRNDKARAFSLYSSMRMTLSDLNVSVDETGTRATAEFDKEWDFRGKKNSSGKVRSQLRMKLDGGRWLITSERDTRVYYTN
ncbi:MAG: hypothetical protein DMF62_06200 [Acidobacteria bacterium]|nr:MAG: hypothetical protein DMF62_06200 [Acidobacteriota bacterium]